tara:strand:+ start:1703 stop:2521 length:819 start_codon:yes stop_codon:yes gene_type:complete
MEIKEIAKSIISRTYYPFHSLLKKNALNIPILCYHSINKRFENEPDPIHPKEFEEHLKYINDYYEVISLSKLAYFLKNDLKPENPSIVITFDDGYIDNYFEAFPLLIKFNAKATFFVVTDFIDGNISLNGLKGWESMNWDNIKEIDSKPNFEIGGHTHSHKILGDLNPLTAKLEIDNSINLLSSQLNRKIRYFAYPFGQRHHFTKENIINLKKNSIQAACSTIFKTYHTKKDLYKLNRINIRSFDTRQKLSKKIKGYYDFINVIQKVKSNLK